MLQSYRYMHAVGMGIAVWVSAVSRLHSGRRDLEEEDRRAVGLEGGAGAHTVPASLACALGSPMQCTRACAAWSIDL